MVGVLMRRRKQHGDRKHCYWADLGESARAGHLVCEALKRVAATDYANKLQHCGSTLAHARQLSTENLDGDLRARRRSKRVWSVSVQIRRGSGLKLLLSVTLFAYLPPKLLARLPNF